MGKTLVIACLVICAWSLYWGFTGRAALPCSWRDKPGRGAFRRFTDRDRVAGLGCAAHDPQAGDHRRLPAVETPATVICSDKTGTLTENRMSVSGSTVAAGYTAGTARVQVRNKVDGLRSAQGQRSFKFAGNCRALHTCEDGSFQGDPRSGLGKRPPGG